MRYRVAARPLLPDAFVVEHTSLRPFVVPDGGGGALDSRLAEQPNP